MTAAADPPPCIGCGAPLTRTVIDLGPTPPCEDFLTADRLAEPEIYYPLDVRICDACLLVQLPVYIPPNHIFREYAYFSSFSDSWVQHAARLVETAIERQGMSPGALVIEAASNDGYLLQHVQSHGLRAVGIEPARNIAEVARARGITTVNEFLSEETAEAVVAEHGQADWVVANNVFAHVPAINDFTAGLATLLKPGGLLSIEVAYLVRLIAGAEFDTIYHEHFAYHTVHAARTVLARQGLRILDVEELPTHGGSIRLWVVHDADPRPTTDGVDAIIDSERALGMDRPTGYGGLVGKVERIKLDLLAYLVAQRQAGRRVVGYGAPGKANTLLNHCGIKADLIEYLVDRNPYKHGRFTPGARIPIHPPERLLEDRPDVIVILPWNLRDEITAQLTATLPWGPDLVVPIPRLEVTTLPRHGTE